MAKAQGTMRVNPAVFSIQVWLMAAGFLRRAKTGRWNHADLARACSDGEFVVSRAEEACDAPVRGQIGNSGLISSAGDSADCRPNGSRTNNGILPRLPKVT